MGKPTPGPWTVRKGEINGELVDCFVTAKSVHGYAYGAEILGDEEYLPDKDMSRKLADAALIAAAPDMLDALEIVKAAFDKSSLSPYAYQTVVDAIKKATEA